MANNSDADRTAFELSADRPGIDPGLDRFGYAPFAKRLAQSILKLGNVDGHVIALYGSWGFGKTTMLNYVRHYLAEVKPSESPIIVAYNPWWFSSHEDLVWALFQQLQAKLKGYKEISRAVRSGLANLGDLLSEAPVPHANLIKPLSGIVRPKPKDIEKLKNDISKALRSQPRRILVIIDDIDRLTSEEIRQVFRAIKSVADFPNVTYLMAFDKSVVEKSLKDLQGGSGQDYLEKIVQIPFELPLVDRLSIKSLFFEKLDLILAKMDPKSFDQTYWGNVFYEGIDKFIETPRDVIRFSNTLAVTCNATEGEVNPIDFIAIESLRMFCPEVYDTIRNNREMFTGHSDDNTRGSNEKTLLEFHDNWIMKLQSSNPIHVKLVKDMLQRLFPKLRALGGNAGFGQEWEPEWRRKLRICSDSVFPVYFAFGTPAGEISNSEMLIILANASDPRRFSADILKLAAEIRPDGKTRASAFLDRLQDYTESEIDIERIEPIISTLLDIGDQLVLPEERTEMFEFGNEVRIGRVDWQLMKRLENDKRFDILRNAFERGRALFMLQRVVIVLGQQQGLHGETNARPEQEWLVTREQLSELENVLLERVRSASKDMALLHTPHLLFVLGFWRGKGAPDEVPVWIAEMIKDDAHLAEFLERCLQSASEGALSDSVARRYDRLDPDWLKPYVDPKTLVERIRGLSKNTPLSNRQSRAAKQFLKEYDFRSRGGNPDDPFAQDQIR